jgi:heme oxygenase (biliverdin-IX-beta and delta-forming)
MISKLLRQHTAALHDRVERSVDLPRRCRSLGAYRGLLGRLLGLYAPLERELARVDWTGLAIDLGPRKKAALLVADLRALELPPAELAALPVCAGLPGLPSAAAALGCLYVLEGATLGGQLITREIHRTLGISAATGGSFHAAYGARTGAMWRSFRAVADEHCGEDPAKVAHALAAAAATFETFASWLGAGSLDSQAGAA